MAESLTHPAARAAPRRRTPLSIMDSYLLRMTAWPMIACLSVTVISLLLERTLRLLDMLAQSSDRFGPVLQLATNLLPHYLGLAMPVAFFVALFIVITRMDDGAEVEAFLASGVSLSRLAAPHLAMGAVLMMVSLVVFGYLQPYSRYAYRAVLHAAVNAGWNGRLNGGAFVSDGEGVLTADTASVEGRRLQNVFILRPLDKGGEEVLTAKSAELAVAPDGKSVTLRLQKGMRMGESKNGSVDTLRFDSFQMQTSLAGASALMRARGGDQRELTLTELARRAKEPNPVIPRRALVAELYARIARSAVLPLLPLMAFPLGLAAKRKRRTAGLLLAGVVLLALQHSLQLGQSMAIAGKISPVLGVWGPFCAFAAFSLWIFAGSRHRPGQTPISDFVHRLGDLLDRARYMIRPRRRRARG